MAHKNNCRSAIGWGRCRSIAALSRTRRKMPGNVGFSVFRLCYTFSRGMHCSVSMAVERGCKNL